MGLAVLALILGSAAPARAADSQLPALNSPASGEHHAGKMLWADLITPDLAAAEKFYGDLFGYDYGDWGIGYVVGPSRCCEHRDEHHHPDRGRVGHRPAYRPAPAGRAAPSIPNRSRTH